MSSPKYLVDTNIIVRRDEHELYDEELFSIYWENFDKLVSNGEIISKPAVYKEIKKLFPGTADKKHKILEWADNHKTMFVGQEDDKYGRESNFIKKNFQGWYKYHNDREFSGDLELVVHAKAYDLVLVTLEGWNFGKHKPKELKIPNICKLLGAFCRNGKDCTLDINPDKTPFQCIDFTELVKRENLHIP